MNAIKKSIAALLFSGIAVSSFAAVTDNQVFAYAEANYASLFSGASQSGVYQQYNYRYYPATKNYLAVDSAKVIHILGPASNNAIQSVGPVSAFEGAITAWEAKQGGAASAVAAGTQMGGAKQGAALNLSGTVTTFAGSTSFGTGDGVGSAATFNQPYGITTDGVNLYVMDRTNSKIRQIVIASGAVTTLATLSGVYYGADSITTDGVNLYTANAYSINKTVIATGVTTALAGSSKGFGSTDGTGAAAKFFTPEGITTDGTNLYVADTGSHKIRKVVIASGVVTTLAGSGTGSSVDGTGTSASFSSPMGITTDGTSLYVADAGSYKIRKIVIASGVVTTLAGAGAFGATDGTGAAAKFSTVKSLTTDGANLYLTDTDNHKIRKIVIATGVVTTIAGGSRSGSSDGSGASATFYAPSGITTDGISLYVADLTNNKIRKIEASGAAGARASTTPVASSSLPAGYFSHGGLTWTPVTISNTSLSAATAYCTGTTINGQTGWRLPTYAELNAAMMAMQAQIWQLRYAYYSTGSNMAFIDYPNTFITCVR